MAQIIGFYTCSLLAPASCTICEIDLRNLAIQSRKLKMTTASLEGDPCLTPQTSQVAVSWSVAFKTSNLSQLEVLE